jgi:hypothetical protein
MKQTEIYTYKAKLAEEKIALQTIKDCHKFLEKQLGVRTSLAVVKEKVENGGDNIVGLYNAKNNVVVINLYTLRGSNIKETISVLSHEMRHAVQYKNKWLKGFQAKNNKGVGYWKGKKYDVGYWDSPWEKDARKYGEKYTSLVIDKLNLKRKSKIKL